MGWGSRLLAARRATCDPPYSTPAPLTWAGGDAPDWDQSRAQRCAPKAVIYGFWLQLITIPRDLPALCNKAITRYGLIGISSRQLKHCAVRGDGAWGGDGQRGCVWGGMG